MINSYPPIQMIRMHSKLLSGLIPHHLQVLHINRRKTTKCCSTRCKCTERQWATLLLEPGSRRCTMTRLGLFCAHRRALQSMLLCIAADIICGNRRWHERRIDNIIAITLFQKSVYDQQLGHNHKLNGFSIPVGME